MHLFKTEKIETSRVVLVRRPCIEAEAPYLKEFHEIEKDFPNFSFHLALDRPDPEADAAGVKYTPGFVHNVLYENYLKNHQAPEDCNLPDVRASNDVGLGGQDARRPGRAAGKYPLRQLSAPDVRRKTEK